MSKRNSEVTASNLTKFVHDTATSNALHTYSSAFRYPNPFRNASATNESSRQITTRTIECGQKGRNHKLQAVVCWSNVQSLLHTSWCRLECVSRERGSCISLRRRPRLTPSITLTICCQNWWKTALICSVTTSYYFQQDGAPVHRVTTTQE